MANISMLVGNDLHFDMVRFIGETLEENRAIIKIVQSLSLHEFEIRIEF